MSKKIMINAMYPEEKRVAIVENSTLVDFYVETASREHLKGNIYKGVVTRVEPGLQAAFVNFGPKKHGFLQLREIQPEYLKNKKKGKRQRIQEVLSKGQEVIVQVEKDARDTKGASLTTYLSLPGRYIVMMPGQDRVGISRKIEDREDRDRLKELFNSLKLPKNMGFILRTACSDRTCGELENDLKYLTKLWNQIKAESKKAAAPALIYKEQDIAVRTVRDYLTSDVDEVLIDDAEAYRRIREFLRKTSPWRKINIKLYKDKRPIFSLHNVEEQIAKINERHVSLPSQGYLVFDRAEALTAIDVNSGRSRKEENIEATALRTNLEAADEIARQLRLRDIGGLVVIDFIDMASSKNRREVENRLKAALHSDKAHTDITGISRFGIVEMTRERLRPAFSDTMGTRCAVCGGTGVLKSDEAVALAALRDIHTKLSEGGAQSLRCSLPVESANYLINAKRSDIAALEKTFGVTIAVFSDTKLLPGSYSIDVESQRSNEQGSEKSNGDQNPDQSEAQSQIEGRSRGRSRSRSRSRGRNQRAEQQTAEQQTAEQQPIEQQAVEQ
ncbi:MAG: Rne/Rng family ribonuclease [Nitrospirota bacterium]